MMEILQITQCLKDIGADNPLCKRAIEKVRRNPKFFLQFAGSSKDSKQIGEEIFQHLHENREKWQTGKLPSTAYFRENQYRFEEFLPSEQLDQEQIATLMRMESTGCSDDFEDIRFYLEEILKMDLYQEAQMIGQAIGSLNQEMEAQLENKPKDPRLKLDEARHRLWIDDCWYDYDEGWAGVLLKNLMEAKGERQPYKIILGDGVAKPSRVLKQLHEKIQGIIDTQTGGTGGIRIKPEYFDLD
jgi:hypothetical protein